MNVVEILKELIAFKSITPEEAGSYAFIHGLLDTFEFEKMDKNEVKNLFIHKKFGEGPHLCFAGHLDVVPPGDGWDTDPFTPIEKEGILYGRGAQDMKSGVAAFLSAVKQTQSFNGTLSFIFTSDEEGPGIHGTKHVLECLKEQNRLPDLCVVAEPTCSKVFGDTIKVGRRGSINGTLKIFGKGGHAAYPEKAINPIHQIAPLLEAIAGKSLDNGDEHFAPSQLVITDIRAGYEVTNLSPGEMKLMFNVRNSTNTTRDDVEAYVKNALKNAGLEQYELSVNQSSYPFITKSGAYSKQLFEALASSVKIHCGVDPEPSTTGGTSDARYIAAFGIDVVEFGVKNDRIHAPNESTPIRDLETLEAIFKTFIGKIGQ
jgi:succinyl-diaminopimelate desuccinylase